MNLPLTAARFFDFDQNFHDTNRCSTQGAATFLVTEKSS